jgi:hypothetical protein
MIPIRVRATESEPSWPACHIRHTIHNKATEAVLLEKGSVTEPAALDCVVVFPICTALQVANCM